jgi:hypothetical protein
MHGAGNTRIVGPDEHLREKINFLIFDPFYAY